MAVDGAQDIDQCLEIIAVLRLPKTLAEEVVIALTRVNVFGVKAITADQTAFLLAGCQAARGQVDLVISVALKAAGDFLLDGRARGARPASH